MSSEVERKVLRFDEWLGEVERRSPEKVYVTVNGSRNVIIGESVIMLP